MTNYKITLIELAKEYKLPYSVVEDIFKSQFKFTKETIEELDVSTIKEEELKDLKTNFNYKYIGKLYAAEKLLKKREKHEGKKL